MKPIVTSIAASSLLAAITITPPKISRTQGRGCKSKSRVTVTDALGGENGNISGI